jgi:hypothetical protein
MSKERREFYPEKKGESKYNFRQSKQNSENDSRKSIDTFNWKEHCLFCGEECHIDTKHPERRPIF